MTPLDPFSKVYDGLWQAVKSHDGLQTLVREGNRISFASDGEEHEPRKTIADYGTCPELQLIPDFFTTAMHPDNVQITVTRTWNWIIRTGSKLLNKELLPVEYQLLLALKAAKKQILALQWDGPKGLYNLVRRYEVVRAASSIPDVDKTENNPQSLAWYSVWAVTTDINIMNPVET